MDFPSSLKQKRRVRNRRQDEAGCSLENFIAARESRTGANFRSNFGRENSVHAGSGVLRYKRLVYSLRSHRGNKEHGWGKRPQLLADGTENCLRMKGRSEHAPRHSG